jgi:hypothetical protein
MRIRPITRTVIGLLVLSQSGCGTMFNLCAPPEPSVGIGPSSCFPFGGTTRSALLGVVGPSFGFCEVMNGEAKLVQGDASEGFKQIGTGLALGGAGIVSIVDTPVSFVGDVATMSVVFARRARQPWAMWWGETKGLVIEPLPPSAPDESPAAEPLGCGATELLL